MPKSNELKRILPQLLRSMADELDRNPELADRLIPSRLKPADKHIQDATASEFDPFELLRTGGESALRERLELLDVPRLKAVISVNALDTTRLAQKWRDKQRLVSFIVERITARAQKGEVFMAS